MNFVVNNTYYFHYFIPLIIELKSRGIKSNVFFFDGKKENSVVRKMAEVKSLSNEYGFNLYRMEDINKFPTKFTFLIEGSGRDRITYRTKKIVITNSTIFTEDCYFPSYINSVDIVFINNKKYFDSWSKKKLFTESKNHYFGSPKYDIAINDNQKILDKYSIPYENILVIYPNSRDSRQVNIESICKTIENCGFMPVIKIRDKYHYSESKYKIINDVGIYPHTTMELISASRGVINFTSSAIEEIVFMRKPCINIHIKPFMEMPFLYKYNFCKNMTSRYNNSELMHNISQITSDNYSNDFDLCFSECVTDSVGACKKIIDFIENNA